MEVKEKSVTISSVMAGIDVSELTRNDVLQDERPGLAKYRDVEKWARHAVEDTSELGLHQSRSMRILDIGAGPGYFGHVAQLHGHEYFALDMQSEFYDAMREWLGVRCVHHRVLPMEPLPTFAPKLDMVTAFRSPFVTNKAEKRMWTLEEWDFFLNDLRDNTLQNGGRFFMKIQNHSSFPGPVFGTPELMDYFRSRGGQISGRASVDFRTILPSPFSAN